MKLFNVSQDEHVYPCCLRCQGLSAWTPVCWIISHGIYRLRKYSQHKKCACAEAERIDRLSMQYPSNAFQMPPWKILYSSTGRTQSQAKTRFQTRDYIYRTCLWPMNRKCPLPCSYISRARYRVFFSMAASFWGRKKR